MTTRDLARQLIQDAEQRIRLRALEGEAYALRYRAALRDVDRYVMFVGYPRTGHTLVCAVLSAHPSVIVANELDALAYVQRSVSRRALFGMLLARDRWWERRHREWTGYDYRVPGQWQGRWSTLRVIGDKTGGHSSMRLGREPALLDQLRATVQVPLRIIHVHRHPLDTVGRMSRAEEWTPAHATDLYLPFTRTVADLRTRVGADEWLDLGLEDLIEDPREQLARLCRFLDVDADPGYLDACQALILPEPNRSRQEVPWDPADIARLKEALADIPVLQNYDF